MPSDVARLHADVDALIAEVREQGAVQAAAWTRDDDRGGFAESALNLAHYLALRRRDLRPLQRRLAALGLSSLGRLEGRVMPTLVAVRRALAALLGHPMDHAAASRHFFAGEARLQAHTDEVLGTSAKSP